MSKLPAEEVFAEVEWLRDGGMHPAQIATQIGRTASSLEKLARNHGRADLSTVFNAEAMRSQKVWQAEYKARMRAKKRAS